MHEQRVQGNTHALSAEKYFIEHDLPEYIINITNAMLLFCGYILLFINFVAAAVGVLLPVILMSIYKEALALVRFKDELNFVDNNLLTFNEGDGKKKKSYHYF